MKLFEILDKSYAENMVLKDYKGGHIGRFTINGLIFTIDLQYEDLETLELDYQISSRYELSDKIFENKIIVRVDYNQIVDGERKFNNTNNAKEFALKVIATVAIEVSNQLKDKKWNIVYFAAKAHEDGTKNQRMTMYPRIGKMMSTRLGALLIVNRETSNVITILAKGLSADDEDELITKVRG